MTDAIPYGIYRAPTEIIRSDALTTNDETHCYVQLLNRLSSQTYAIRVAASCEDLLALSRSEDESFLEESDRVFVSTITREALHLQCRLLVAPRTVPSIYAAPDYVLQDKQSDGGLDLQLFASSGWICYFQILQPLPDGSARVRVAAIPRRLNEETDRAFVTTLSQRELSLSIELDSRDLSRAGCDIREKVETHAETILHHSVPHIHPNPETKRELLDEEADLLPLESLFIPHTAIREAFAVLEITEEKDRRIHTAILHAAVDTLTQKIERTSERKRRKLEKQLNQIRTVRAWRRERRSQGYKWQRVASLEKTVNGWDVIIGVPEELAA